jgi:HK97 family phage portal protein
MKQEQAKKPGRVKAMLQSWLGVPVGLTTDDFWKLWGSNKAGQQVNPNTVLSLSAAFACTRLISEVVASLPLHVYQRVADGRREAPEHTLNGIIQRKPNADSNAMTYWESTTASILLRGTGFSERLEVGGRLVGLQFLHPDRLSITLDANSRYVFRYAERGGRQREIPRTKIFYIPGFSTNGMWGASVITHGASAFGTALAADAAAANTFERGLMPTVALKYPKVLNPQQRTEARETMERLSGAVNAGKPVILEADSDALMLGIKPSDAQLLEARGYSVEDVCRFFRVDPSLIGHGNKDSNWGTGLEQKMLAFLALSLRPWLVRIQQAINTQLFTLADQQRYYAEFSIEGLLQADSAARSAFYAAMTANGIMTRDEVRRKENLPPKGGNADVLTVQTAMAPLDSLGVQSQGNVVRNALAAWLGIPSEAASTRKSSDEE